jgi:hypothetical protein
MMRLTVLAVLALLAGCGPSSSDAPDSAPPTAQASVEARVVSEIASIDSMRSANAASLRPGDAIDGKTFAEVCMPVGQRMRGLAVETGWSIRPAAAKYRNPANAATEAELALIARFEADPSLLDLWETTDVGARRYVRRIAMQPGCLGCHGPSETLPAFVAERYPDDRAHGFEVGDLRGLYVVEVHGTSDS